MHSSIFGSGFFTWQGAWFFKCQFYVIQCSLSAFQLWLSLLPQIEQVPDRAVRPSIWFDQPNQPWPTSEINQNWNLVREVKSHFASMDPNKEELVAIQVVCALFCAFKKKEEKAESQNVEEWSCCFCHFHLLTHIHWLLLIALLGTSHRSAQTWRKAQTCTSNMLGVSGTLPGLGQDVSLLRLNMSVMDTRSDLAQTWVFCPVSEKSGTGKSAKIV